MQNSVRATTSTIGKGNQDLRDIPQSMTVVTEKLIEDRRVDTLKEALHNTAGITLPWRPKAARRTSACAASR